MAGVIAELLIAAIATMIWAHTPEGLIHQMAYNVMLTATFFTLVFNANPLLKFDVYYVLADLLEIPNLYSLGQQYVRHLGRRYILAVPSQLPSWPYSKSLAIKAYGIAAFCWRWLVCVGLTITAATLFHNAGIVLAILSLAMWIGLPSWKLVHYLAHGDNRERPNRIRILAVAAGGFASFAFFLSLPQPGGIRAPAVVTYSSIQVVRAPYTGFVKSLPLASGSTVAKNQIAAVLENADLEAETKSLELAIEQSLLRSRYFRKRSDIAALQVEEDQRRSLETRLSERLGQLQQSEIRTAGGGTVVTRNVRGLQGRFVREGQPLFEIGMDSRKELRLSVSQDDFDFFKDHVGRNVDVYIRSPGQRPLSCKLTRVNPRASRQVEHTAMASANGGNLLVRPAAPVDSDAATRAVDGREPIRWELLQPRFSATVALNNSQSRSLRAGQLTTVRLDDTRGSIGEAIYRFVSNWVCEKVDRARRG